MFTSEEEQMLFRARVAMLVRSPDMSVPFLSQYESVEALASDPQAVTNLTHAGLAEPLAIIVARWARNYARSMQEGWPEFMPEQIYQLGVSSPEVMIGIGTIFSNLYVLSFSQPEDLQQAIPMLSADQAREIRDNAKRIYDPLGTRGGDTEPHLHQLRAFVVTPEGMEEVGSLPPYDINQPTPPEQLDGIIAILRQAGVIKDPEGEDNKE